MNIEEIQEVYNKNLKLYKRLEEESKFIIESKLNDSNIKVHYITSRIKKLDSLVDKINRKQINEPFKEINDILGLRIVTLFLSDISIITEIIKDSFDIISEDNKVESADLSSFSYMSVHFIVKLKDTYSGPRYNDILKFTFEIQLRTIVMDAWANISHYLDYKSENAIPKDLKKDFYALSGLFYVADKHFELFYKSSIKSKENMKRFFNTNKTSFNKEINLDSLLAYCIKKFPDRDHGSSRDFSDLVNELVKAGYKSIEQLDSIINMGFDNFIIFEKEYPPENGRGQKTNFSDIGIIRVTLELYDDNYIKANNIGSNVNVLDFRKEFGINDKK